MKLDFVKFRNAMLAHINSIWANGLYTTNVSKDILWATYLASFPQGSNPIFRERTEHDCQCCKQFIRTVGDMVAIIDNHIVTIWDFEIGGPYQKVIDAMSEIVRSKHISDKFCHYSKKVGYKTTVSSVDGEIISWDHFHWTVPPQYIVSEDDMGTYLNNCRSNAMVLYRSLNELTMDAGLLVQELIVDDSIYRGEEHLPIVKKFIELKKVFDDLPLDERENYCWVIADTLGGSSKIRNTVIGTLLDDLSKDVSLTKAVKKFEHKVAGDNYKRPKALVTKGMKKKAMKFIIDNNLEDSLERRYSTLEDITINNVLFADRSAKKHMSAIEKVMDSIDEKPGKSQNFDRVTSVPLKVFMDDILPGVTSMEVLVKNEYKSNMVSLISPVYPDSKRIFKWDNNFSWSYTGEYADSLKERVKNAGGNVNAYLAWRLGWYNFDDLDLQIEEPDGNIIRYNNRHSLSGGFLDVDMNALSPFFNDPVENIAYPKRTDMPEGIYTVRVHQYTQRNRNDIGFHVQMAYGDEVTDFHYNDSMPTNVLVKLAVFEYRRDKGVKLISSIPSNPVEMDLWSVKTNQFQPVEVVMYSPNHWDNNNIGNKHVFFMLKDCVNPESTRGFYNEFLTNDLRDNRKVFDVLASSMKCPESDRQLSGLGFSTTKRDSLVVKVKGASTRVLKVLI